MPWPDYFTCQGCGKRGYPSRKAARRIAKSMPGTSVYRCQDAPTELWHLGHLPKHVVTGRSTRDTLTYAARRPVFYKPKHRAESGDDEG